MFSNLLLAFALAVLHAAFIDACGPIDPGRLLKTGTALQRKMGPSIREVGTVPNKGDGETVTSSSQLSCSSSNRDNCCWRQGSQSTIEWVTATGTADDGLMNTNFPGQGKPTGIGFLAAYSNEAAQGGAILESCVIPCVEGPIDISLKSWQTSEVYLQACLTPITNFSPTNCQPISPGQQSVTLQPLDEPMRMVLISSGYTDPTGNIVAMDDLNVNANINQDPNCNDAVTPEPTQPTPEPTVGPVSPVELCRKTTCSFDAGDPCSFQGFSSSSWGVHEGRLGNLNTGIRRAAPGSEPNYAGVTVPPGSKKVMRTGPIDVKEPMELQFKAYEATMDVRLRACVNDENNCPWESNPRVSSSDLSWTDASIPLDTNTREVFFVAENVGQNYGTAGVDDIRLFGAAGGQVNC